MKRMLITASAIIVLVMSTVVVVSAEKSDIGASADELRDDTYSEQYEESGASEITELLPEEYRELVDGLKFDPSSLDNSADFSAESVFSLIIGIFRGKLSEPFTVGAAALGVIIISSLIKSVASQSSLGGINDGISAAVTAAILFLPIYGVFKASCNAVKAAAVFMCGFIPIFAGILVSSGKPLTSSLTSVTVLSAAEVVEQVSAFVVLPMLAVMLAMGAASVFSERIRPDGCVAAVKKTVGVLMTVLMTVFSGVTSVQSMIGSAADSPALRTVKFVTGSAPVIGGAVSEAAGLVSSCLSALKNSAAIYAIICLCSVLLPVIAEALAWRLVAYLLGASSGLFGCDRITRLTDAVGYSFGIITSVALNTFVMFTLSLTVMTMVGG